MRVLFLNPCIPRRKFYINVGLTLPPMGILTLASTILDNNEVKIIDSQKNDLKSKDILVEIMKFKPDLICVSTMTFDFLYGVDLTKKIKKEFPDIVIIFGGPHVSLSGEKLLESYKCIDYIFRGPCFSMFEKITKMIKSGNIKKTKGLCYRSGKRIVDGGISNKLDNLNKIKPLPFNLLDNYSASYGFDNLLGLDCKTKITPQIPLLSSQGCMYRCKFCSVPNMYSGKTNFVSIGKIIKDIKYLKDKYNINSFCFQDDNFTSNNLRLKRLCKQIIEEKLNINWWCWGRIDWASNSFDLLKLMKRSGCTSINFGVESTNNTILKTYNKHTRLIQIKSAIKKTKQAKLEVIGNFIIGSEHETVKNITNTINFAKKHASIAAFNVLAPIIGTDLFVSLSKNKKILTKNWKKYDNCHAVIKSKHVSPDKVEELFRFAYRDFYLRDEFIESLNFENKSKLKNILDKGIRREEKNVFGKI